MSSTASITKIAPKQADSNAYKEDRILPAIEAIQKIKYQAYKQPCRHLM